MRDSIFFSLFVCLLYDVIQNNENLKTDLMKHDKKSNKQTCSKLTITATIDEMMFLEELVKHLADGRKRSTNRMQDLQPDWLTINTSSLEAHVSGNMIASDSGDPLRIPYTTCFLFTCIKERTGGYTLEGSFSLS